MNQGDEQTRRRDTPMKAPRNCRTPGRPAARRRRGNSERGAALVEFAIILPVMMVLLMGTVSGGIAMNRRASVNSAAREGARYGATVAQNQCTPTSQCGGMSWAQLVQAVAVQRSSGDVTTSQVCAALVSGSGSSPVAVDSAHTTAGGTSPCFVDNSSDTGLRVQVMVSRPDQIQLVVSQISVSLDAQSIVKYEQ